MSDLWLHGRPPRDGESNITYEDVQKAADENGRSVRETLDIVDRTVAGDRDKHSSEYA